MQPGFSGLRLFLPASGAKKSNPCASLPRVWPIAVYITSGLRASVLVTAFCHLRFPSHLAAMSSLKRQLLEQLKEQLLNNQSRLLSAMEELRESLATETKSSVGDKHETARAKMQFEEDKLQHQLSEAGRQLGLLSRYAGLPATNAVSAGSLVQTNQGYLYLGLSVGKLTVHHTPVLVLSPESPLGKAFLGKSVDDEIPFNGLKYKILQVC